MKEFFYTYILWCADNSLYTGVTNDIIIRVNQHNSENYPRSYCHTRRPVQLAFIKVFNNPEDAIRYEKQIKRWSRSKKIALIYGDLKKLHELAECRNESHFKYFNK
jgi:putative endonuclease